LRIRVVATAAVALACRACRVALRRDRSSLTRTTAAPFPSSSSVRSAVPQSRLANASCIALTLVAAVSLAACHDATAPATQGALRGAYLLTSVDGRSVPTYLSQTDTSRLDVTIDSLHFTPGDSSVVHGYAFVNHQPGLTIVGKVTSPADRYHVAADGSIRIDDYGYGNPASGQIVGDKLVISEPATGHIFEYRER
jgi:hypothetical protein